jgi:hypothetical protein
VRYAETVPSRHRPPARREHHIDAIRVQWTCHVDGCGFEPFHQLAAAVAAELIQGIKRNNPDTHDQDLVG